MRSFRAYFHLIGILSSYPVFSRFIVKRNLVDRSVHRTASLRYVMAISYHPYTKNAIHFRNKRNTLKMNIFFARSDVAVKPQMRYSTYPIYDLSAVIGTTYTPSSRRYAAFDSPHTTPNSLGGRPLSASMLRLISIRFFAASSI